MRCRPQPLAIQAARELARRAQCINDVKQIGVTIANDEAASGSLPTGVINTKLTERCTGWRNANAFGFLLPQLEAAPQYNSINFDYGNAVSATRSST